MRSFTDWLTTKGRPHQRVADRGEENMDDEHQCNPDDHPDAWDGAGWEGTRYECPDCGTDWFVDVSYKGPGYTNAVLSWDRF